ncbi:hypothetical protein Q7P35_001014 [Cladosporium inversicolor]
MATQTTNPQSGSQQAFPLMKLPAKLRISIYEYALLDTINHILSSISSPTPVPGVPVPACGTLALFLASKAVRAESSKSLASYMSPQVSIFKICVSMLEIEQNLKDRAIVRAHLLQLIHGGSTDKVAEARDALSQKDRELGNATAALHAMSNAHDAVWRAINASSS